MAPAQEATAASTAGGKFAPHSCGSADLTKQLSLIASPAKGGDGPEPMSCGGGGCANCPAMVE